MADREPEQNRSEPASPFKLKEARDRGQVAKSQELNGVAALLAFVALLYAAGPALLQRQLRADAALLGNAHLPGFSEASAAALLGAYFLETLWLLAPVFGALLAAGVIASLLQTGPVFSFVPLKPDAQRINPVAGLKRLFSRRILVELVKTLLKLALLGYALYAILDALLPRLLGLAQTDPAVFGRIGLETAAGLLLRLALVMLLVALLDLAYVRWDYAQQMRMSRREMREELKRREGDPKIRARIRELQREMRKRAKALARVPDADVLITNPRRLAVALAYRAGEMAAPQVLAKGAGELAARMRALARRHGVPLVEDRPLARRLFLGAQIDAPIPQDAYAAAARALAWVFALRELRRAGRAAA
jgi:flagellar biosynthetic protein FlhB